MGYAAQWHRTRQHWGRYWGWSWACSGYDRGTWGPTPLAPGVPDSLIPLQKTRACFLPFRHDFPSLLTVKDIPQHMSLCMSIPSVAWSRSWAWAHGSQLAGRSLNPGFSTHEVCGFCHSQGVPGRPSVSCPSATVGLAGVRSPGVSGTASPWCGRSSLEQRRGFSVGAAWEAAP